MQKEDFLRDVLAVDFQVFLVVTDVVHVLEHPHVSAWDYRVCVAVVLDVVVDFWWCPIISGGDQTVGESATGDIFWAWQVFGVIYSGGSLLWSPHGAGENAHVPKPPSLCPLKQYVDLVRPFDLVFLFERAWYRCRVRIAFDLKNHSYTSLQMYLLEVVVTVFGLFALDLGAGLRIRAPGALALISTSMLYHTDSAAVIPIIRQHY